MKYIFNPRLGLLAVALSLPLATGSAPAEDNNGFGKLDPTPPAAITAEQIVAKFAAREAEFAAARENYTFRQSVKVDILNEARKVDGEYGGVWFYDTRP